MELGDFRAYHLIIFLMNSEYCLKKIFWKFLHIDES